MAGALAGGLIGNQFGKGSGRVAATAVGAVAGGMIGNGIGAQMDAEDRRRAAEAQYQALEYGRPVSWNNPQSQYSGQVAVGNPYQQNGNNCRSYTNTIYIDGRPEVSRGVACRQPDGTWRTVS
ncbi:RT0821/Lpp0805 family surface protein [Methyloligella sp. 2.7D]|uniref:RT0821/Lpp0805 family surface protein n=1 Tax=unclassified Methyloligella TaxID=2625955 RepID=UPI001FF03CCA|nr:RT0821/Lpp0805 family surface protein [Methyloligella sp. GL2]